MPIWILMLVMNGLGYLGLLQSVGIIFDAANVELDNIEYQELGRAGGNDMSNQTF